MASITLTLVILFGLLNYASGIACFFILYYLVRNNRKKKALGISYNQFVNFILCSVFIFCAFCESIFFFFSLEFLIQSSIDSDFSGGELYVGFMFFIFVGFVHACGIAILGPWYYYEKNLNVITDRKTLIEGTKKALCLAMFVPFVFFGYFFLL